MRWLGAARAAVDRNLQAVVGGQQRGYYDRAAQLAVACGEALSIADPDGSGDYAAAQCAPGIHATSRSDANSTPHAPPHR